MNWLVVLIFVILNEAVIEFFVGNISALRPLIPLFALASAILICFYYQLSVFNLLLGTPVTHPFLEFLISAFIIARLSNYLNDFVQRYLKSK